MYDQQQRQKYQLQQEIRLLEKEKNDLQLELERAEVVQKEVFTQQTKEIKDLTTRKLDLMEQVGKLKETMSILTDAYTSSKSSMETFLKTYMEDTKKESDTLLSSAKEVVEIAKSKLIHVESQLKTLLEREKTLKHDQDALLMDQQRLRNGEILLTGQKEAHQQEIQRWEVKLNELDSQKHLLENDITRLTDSKNELIEYIMLQNRYISEKLDKANKKETEAHIKMTELIQKDKILQTKEKVLENEKILLKDRQGQLDRAIQEYRGKGVKV